MLMVSSCVNEKGEGLVTGYSWVRQRSLKNLLRSAGFKLQTFYVFKLCKFLKCDSTQGNQACWLSLLPLIHCNNIVATCYFEIRLKIHIVRMNARQRRS